MKNTAILEKINSLLDHNYPDIEGVLFFGSASFKTKNYQDVDLLLIDEKFSYVSKSNIFFENINFSIIKIPSNDLFNILAQDFKSGIYRNIFETGFIVKDNLKILRIVKQYICKDYPDTSNILHYNRGKIIFKINECINTLKKNLPLIEEYLVFSSCISYLIDFIILKDEKINFSTTKHKSRYLHKYQLKYAIEINEILNNYRRNKNAALKKLEKLIQSLAVPQTLEYNNDFLIDRIEDLDMSTLYIPKLIKKNIDVEFLEKIKKSLITYYAFYIDENKVMFPNV